MARVNLKFTKPNESDVIEGYYFNCEEEDIDTFKAAKVSDGFTFIAQQDPDMSEATEDEG